MLNNFLPKCSFNSAFSLATPKNHIILTEITKKSKAYWNYSEEQLQKWDEELTITERYIEENEVYILMEKETVIAYYSFFKVDTDTIKLDNLFLLPSFIGKGYGKLLVNDFMKKVKAIQAKKIVLDADPNAELFYKKLDFITVAKLKTSIEGRFLRIMERKL
ncbi:GNAT family N-acetyltransferase [Bernardetia sp. OM2101]|uniref:GNAT family N-acetyltransferase n=1 Tax=Bernardetia sp. OM2101 TaxID=3344876 RepID=UPI0035D00D36